MLGTRRRGFWRARELGARGTASRRAGGAAEAQASTARRGMTRNDKRGTARRGARARGDTTG